MQEKMIIVSEYCSKCQINPAFIFMLEEDGLIDIQIVGKEKYLLNSQLAELERFARLYYDLSINIEGIDAIQHLLNKMEKMRNELSRLRKEVSFYRRRALADDFF